MYIHDYNLVYTSPALGGENQTFAKLFVIFYFSICNRTLRYFFVVVVSLVVIIWP